MQSAQLTAQGTASCSCLITFSHSHQHLLLEGRQLTVMAQLYQYLQQAARCWTYTCLQPSLQMLHAMHVLLCHASQCRGQPHAVQRAVLHPLTNIHATEACTDQRHAQYLSLLRHSHTAVILVQHPRSIASQYSASHAMRQK